MQTKNGLELFGIESLRGMKVDIPEKEHDLVPVGNPDYVFFIDTLRVVLKFLFNGSRIKSGMYLFGPSGSGKTSVVEQACNRLRLPVVYECAANELTWSDLVGSFQFVEQGKMSFILGSLARAYKFGWVFLLDEMDRWDVPAPFYGLLEGKPITLPTGEVIKKHPNFRLFATGNTGGKGDFSGKYLGTRAQNEALLQRFSALEVTYIQPDVETRVLEKFAASIDPSMDVKVITDLTGKMVKVAEMIREQQAAAEQGSSESEPIEIDFSTRTLLSWTEEMIEYKSVSRAGLNPLYYGLDRAVLARASKPTQELVKQIVHDVFGV